MGFFDRFKRVPPQVQHRGTFAEGPLPLAVDGYASMGIVTPDETNGRPIRRDNPARYMFGVLEIQKYGSVVPWAGYQNYDAQTVGSYLFRSPHGSDKTLVLKLGGSPHSPSGPSTVAQIYEGVYGNQPVQGVGPGGIWYGQFQTPIPPRTY
jgi:hypothetical protein